MYRTVLTPTLIGPLELVASEHGLCAVRFLDDESMPDEPLQGELPEVLARAVTQLKDYFQGRRKVFDIPLAPEGTEFQRGVWQEVASIPYGRTSSYGEIAERLGNPKAVRAVGAANGRNPIPIIIPCHRVIGSDGSLTGYAGGLNRKAALLSLEGVQFQTSPAQHSLLTV